MVWVKSTLGRPFWSKISLNPVQACGDFGVGFANNDIPAGMGGKGNELIHMPGPFEFQITDAIAHSNCSHVWSQPELLNNFWLPAVS